MSKKMVGINYNDSFFSKIQKELLKAFPGQERDSIFFIQSLKEKFEKANIELGRNISIFNDKGKISNITGGEKNNKKKEDLLDENFVVVIGDEVIEPYFNILILDIDNKLSYYFVCTLKEIYKVNKINGIQAAPILKLLDNDKEMFKEYLLDIIESLGLEFQDFLDLLIEIYKEKFKLPKIFINKTK